MRRFSQETQRNYIRDVGRFASFLGRPPDMATADDLRRFQVRSVKYLLLSWQSWAVLSACFAALTAIFAKVGVENVSSDFATFIRTIVILLVLGTILAATNQFQPLSSISSRTYLFLVLSRLAAGASWICYFRALQLGDAARVAPIDKLSVVLVAMFGVTFLKEHLSLSNWVGVILIATGAVLVGYKG
ncbi:EamA family transporter [Mesorhizobium sp. M1322]